MLTLHNTREPESPFINSSLGTKEPRTIKTAHGKYVCDDVCTSCLLHDNQGDIALS